MPPVWSSILELLELINLLLWTGGYFNHLKEWPTQKSINIGLMRTLHYFHRFAEVQPSRGELTAGIFDIGQRPQTPLKVTVIVPFRTQGCCSSTVSIIGLIACKCTNRKIP